MTSILFLKKAIYCNIIRWNFLRNEKYFMNFFLHFLNLDSIFKNFKKNDSHTWCVFELTDSEKRGKIKV